MRAGVVTDLDALMDVGRPILTVNSTSGNSPEKREWVKTKLFVALTFDLHPASAPADSVSAIRSSFFGFHVTILSLISESASSSFPHGLKTISSAGIFQAS